MKDFLKVIKLNESTVSTILSAAAMIMVTILLWNYFKSVNVSDSSQTSSAATENQVVEVSNLEELSSEDLPAMYTVQKGDSLWKIAEKAYGDGWEYKRIAQENSEVVTNPSLIDVGMKLTLPKMEKEEAASEYTVQSGDSLWEIAQDVCGDGYAWSQIATDNQLANPSVIHKGNVLEISCR